MNTAERGASEMTNTPTSPILMETPSKKAFDTLEISPRIDEAPAAEVEISRAPETTEGPSNAKLALILGCMWIGVVLTALDSTIVATLLIPISTSFRSLTSLAWLGNSYLIGTAATQPLCGRLTEIFGRRNGLVVANLTFALGTLICGLSRREWHLILGRVIAGLGGGAIYAISTFVGSDLVPVSKRGVVTGINNICYGVGTGVGGLFGGWINDVLGWKWAFYIQVPFIVTGTILVFFVVNIPVKESDRSKIRRIDYLGCFTLVTALVLLLLGLNAGGNLVSWKSPLVLTTIPLSALILVIFFLIERDFANEPVIPLHLLQNPSVMASSFTYWFAYMSLYGIMYYVPVYIELQGFTTTQAGLRFLANSGGTAVAALAAGIVMRATGLYYKLNLVAHACNVLGSGLLLNLSLNTPTWPPYFYLAIAGLGFGGILVITLTSIISAVGRQEQSLATSVSFAFRSTGSTLGVTITTSVFQNVLARSLSSALGHSQEAESIAAEVRRSFAALENLDPPTRAKVAESYMKALTSVFGTTLGMSILAAFSCMFIREHTLHKTIVRT